MPSVGPPARPFGLHGRLAVAACFTADVAVVTAIVIIIEAGLSAVMAPLSGVLISHLQIYNKSTTFGLYFLPKYIPILHLHIFCLFATTFYHCAPPTKAPAVIPRPASATALRRRCAHPRNRLTHNDLRYPDQAPRKRPPFTPQKAAFHLAKGRLPESKRPSFGINPGSRICHPVLDTGTSRTHPQTNNVATYNWIPCQARDDAMCECLT